MDEKKHNLALFKFFSKKRKLHKNEIEQRNEIRSILINRKRIHGVTKKVSNTIINQLRETRQYKYVVYLDRFVIQDINTEQEEVVVQRFPKLNILDSIQECDIELNKLSKELLDIKYSYLFEYKEIQNYEEDHISLIEPNETKYEELEKKKEQIKKKQKEPFIKNETTKEEIKLQQSRCAQQLKEYDVDTPKNRKIESMTEYIMKQKELLGLMLKPIISIEHDDKELKKNEKQPRLEIEELAPLEEEKN